MFDEVVVSDELRSEVFTEESNVVVISTVLESEFVVPTGALLCSGPLEVPPE